ncbi:MAG TPA: tail fiber protein [Methanothrix sp.]|nr:tail fiber protein [Methanothrix sp.]
MSEGFLGEIRMFAGGFAPQGWMECNGQVLPISQYQALYSILGTVYGGNGTTTFALPNLNGRVPMHFGQGPGRSHAIGESAGSSGVTLTVDQIPAHSHSARLKGSSQGNRDSPAGNVPGAAAGSKAYSQASANILAYMDGQSVVVSDAGASAPHENMQPYLTTTFIICMVGIYPSRS